MAFTILIVLAEVLNSSTLYASLYNPISLNIVKTSKTRQIIYPTKKSVYAQEMIGKQLFTTCIATTLSFLHLLSEEKEEEEEAVTGFCSIH